MKELDISPDFTVEDIRKVRDYLYELTKDMSTAELIAHINESAEYGHRRMEELRVKAAENSVNISRQ